MRFIAVLRSSESHGFPPPTLHERIAALGAEATRCGALVDTAGLLPSATAIRVAVTDGRLTITERSTPEVNPLAAYALYDVASRDEVVEWTKRFMDLHRRTWPTWDGESEIRQIFGPES